MNRIAKGMACVALTAGLLLTMTACGEQPDAPAAATTATTTTQTTTTALATTAVITVATTMEETTTVPTSEATTASKTTKESAPVATLGRTPTADNVSLSGSRILRDVPYINQMSRWPTGCESVSVVMALQYAGYSIDVDTFIDRYLPCGDKPRYVKGQLVGCDPWKAFPGDPRSKSGWGCFSPVISRAATAFTGDAARVVELSGWSLARLCAEYIDQGVPVVVWATGGMAAPKFNCRWTATDTGRVIEWKTPMHCLLLVGYDATCYYFNDPQACACKAYAKSACNTAYSGMGAQAIVILPERMVTTTTTTSVTTTTTTVQRLPLSPTWTTAETTETAKITTETTATDAAATTVATE